MRAWVARDKDGSLWLYFDKPLKSKVSGFWADKDMPAKEVHEEFFVDGYFNSVQWEDEEPTECEYWPWREEDRQYINLLT